MDSGEAPKVTRQSPGWWISLILFYHPAEPNSLRSSVSAPLPDDLASLDAGMKHLSRRGFFDGKNLHFNMLIFNELQRRHYKRSEGSPSSSSTTSTNWLLPRPLSLVPRPWLFICPWLYSKLYS